MALIARIGTNGALGHAVEYVGPVVAQMSMAERMTLCNMTIEAGSRIGLVAPDEMTFAFLKDRRLAPTGDAWSRAVSYWQSLVSDPGATYDRSIEIDVSKVEPQVSWGTSPHQTLAVGERVPDPAEIADPVIRRETERALTYMGLSPGQSLKGIPVDTVFIGSCTNGRIEDLRAAAAIAMGRKVNAGVKALVVPGSAATRRQAEAEGLDRIFIEAGFEWRFAGCSMCVAMNDDRLLPGQRCASTSNRNFEGRQGPGGRTHLMSPVMAATAAITGRITDVREPI